jgi:hypothetical protein
LGFVVLGYAVMHSVDALAFFKAARGSAPTVEAQRDHEAEILRSIRDRRVIELGPGMGNIHSHAIPKWVKVSSGEILYFKGYVGDNFSLDSIPVGYVVIEPGLMYGEGDGERADPGA